MSWDQVTRMRPEVVRRQIDRERMETQQGNRGAGSGGPAPCTPWDGYELCALCWEAGTQPKYKGGSRHETKTSKQNRDEPGLSLLMVFPANVSKISPHIHDKVPDGNSRQSDEVRSRISSAGLWKFEAFVCPQHHSNFFIPPCSTWY